MEKTYENSKQTCSNSNADEYPIIPNNDEPQPLLVKKKKWIGNWICQYNGFWFPLIFLQPIISFQKHFEAAGTDIILAAVPKAGTTWLKALTFSIVNRCRFSIDKSPLLTSNPHSLVPSLETNIYRDNRNPDLIKNIPSPRLYATHLHYQLLPDSIKESDCRVIYICRNPLDQFVSFWHFLVEGKVENGGTLVKKDLESTSITPMDEAFEMYCQGIHDYGPFWEHMLEYWNAHLKNPGKVLFLKYEDLKKDITSNVKKIAEFIGYPFSLEEEEQGLIQQICELCGFNNLKNLEINKVGATINGYKHSSLFRKGENGDWVNHLSPSMAERLEKVVEMKLKGSGLMFDN